MRVRALPVVVILLLLVLAIPRVVLSNTQFNQVRITGVITSIQSWQETFVLQELGQFGQGRVWTVRVTAETETRRNGNGAVSRGGPAAFSLLRVGDVVELEGFLVGNSLLFARWIDVRSAVVGNGGNRDDDDDDEDDDDRDRGGREIRLLGVITAMDARGQGILQVQAQSSVQGLNIWTVRLYPKTEVNGQRLTSDRDDRKGKGKSKGKGHRSAFRLLRVGDFIEVEGRIIGNRQIRAEEITLRGHTSVSPVPAPIPNPVPFPTPFPTPFPNPVPFPTPGPIPGQIVIHSPRQGAEIATGEFSVVGQTVPGAQVRVEVTARFGVLGAPLPVTSGTVTADNNGFFTFLVRPPVRVPGTVYTIRVSSASQGLNAPPVSVTVRQL